MATQLLKRLKSRITDVLSQPHLNLDYFQYVVNQEAFIVTAASTIFNIPAEIAECLLSLQNKILAAKRVPVLSLELEDEADQSSFFLRSFCCSSLTSPYQCLASQICWVSAKGQSFGECVNLGCPQDLHTAPYLTVNWMMLCSP